MIRCCAACGGGMRQRACSGERLRVVASVRRAYTWSLKSLATKRAPSAAAQAGECARATARIAAAARGRGAHGPSQHICPRRRFCLMPAACKQQNDERRPQRRLASACGRRRESPQQRAGVGPTDGPSLHSPVVDGDRSKSWRLTKRNA